MGQPAMAQEIAILNTEAGTDYVNIGRNGDGNTELYYTSGNRLIRKDGNQRDRNRCVGNDGRHRSRKKEAAFRVYLTFGELPKS
jgi:hypothetical protein